jgi:hypothetical protein
MGSEWPHIKHTYVQLSLTMPITMLFTAGLWLNASQIVMALRSRMPSTMLPAAHFRA